MSRRHAIILTASLAIAGACGHSSSVSTKQAQSWPAKWCSATPGMTSKQIVAIMGEPTEKFPDSMKWMSNEYRFSAFFNADGTARQLDADASINLDCNSTRTASQTAAAGAMATNNEDPYADCSKAGQPVPGHPGVAYGCSEYVPHVP